MPSHLYSNEVYARPIIPLLITMMVGIISGTRLPGQEYPVYLIILSSGTFIVYAFLRKRPAFFSPLLFFLSLGYLSIQPWIHPNFPHNHVTHFTDSGPFTITGTIVDNPANSGRRTRFILDTTTLADFEKTFPVTGNIRVTAYGRMPELMTGDRISFRSRIRSIRNFNNPGGFDYKRYMTFRKIWGTAYFSENKFMVLKRNTHKRFTAIPSEARKKISRLIEQTANEEQRAVLKALITGEKNEIPKSLRQAFSRAGISHILAISGLHIGIVATVSFFFFSWMLSHIRPLLWKAWIGKGAALLSLFPVFTYGVIAGMSPSTQRAVIMVSIFMLTFLFKREQDTMNTLALAGALILVVNPPSLFSISFQLSFAAVFFILYGLSVLPAMKQERNSTAKAFIRSRIQHKLATFFMVSLFAILGTLPIVMYYFNQLSFIGLLTNFIFIPVIGFMVVPLGLTSVLILPFSASIAEVCMKTSAIILDFAIEAVYFFSATPFSGMKTITPGWLEMLCFYLLLLIALHLVGRKKAKDSASYREGHAGQLFASGTKLYRPFSKKRSAIIAVILLLVILCADSIYWVHQRFWHQDLRVTVIDVGQGSATLLELPEGPTMLVDGGGFSDNSAFDMGEKVIAPLLWRKKIKTINTLILSHPNSDHLNGLLFVAKHFNVKQVLSNNQQTNTVGYREFLKIIEQEKICHLDYSSLQKEFSINDVNLKILYPPVDFLQKRKRNAWRNLNNNSIVLKATFGVKSFLIPGDLMAEAEEELVAMHGDELKSTVLLSPHHGSRTSSTASFLSKVQPEIAIISAGWKNNYHFPHPNVIKRYSERGCKIYRTDRHGAVLISTDGKSLLVKPSV